MGLFPLKAIKDVKLNTTLSVYDFQHLPLSKDRHFVEATLERRGGGRYFHFFNIFKRTELMGALNNSGYSSKT